VVTDSNIVIIVKELSGILSTLQAQGVTDMK